MQLSRAAFVQNKVTTKMNQRHTKFIYFPAQ